MRRWRSYSRDFSFHEKVLILPGGKSSEEMEMYYSALLMHVYVQYSIGRCDFLSERNVTMEILDRHKKDGWIVDGSRLKRRDRRDCLTNKQWQLLIGQHIKKRVRQAGKKKKKSRRTNHVNRKKKEGRKNRSSKTFRGSRTYVHTYPFYHRAYIPQYKYRV